MIPTGSRDDSIDDNDNKEVKSNEHDYEEDLSSDFYSQNSSLIDERPVFNGITDHIDDQTELSTTLSFRIVVDIFEDDKEPRTCVISTCATDTVEKFKRAIKMSENIPVENQRLIFSGQQLKNDRHLSFDPNHSVSSIGDGYRMKPGDTCTLVVLTPAQVALLSSPKMKVSSTSKSTTSIISQITNLSYHHQSHPYLRTSRNKVKPMKKAIARKNRSIHVRSKPTVAEIRRGGLTPEWARRRKLQKPSDQFLPTNYHPFGEKSDESFMKSDMVNGGLHPYLFDRQKKIPALIQKKRPNTAHAGSLARQLGLPESDAEWDSALEMQFKKLFFQLSPNKRDRVLNDLILHSRDFSDQKLNTRTNEFNATGSQKSQNNILSARRDMLGSNNTNNGRIKMSERSALKQRIYQLQTLSKTLKENLSSLEIKYNKLKETSRAHITATKVNLRRTQIELRERITNEMTGALLTPEEAKNMLEERQHFQSQVHQLEQQLNELKLRVKGRNTSIANNILNSEKKINDSDSRKSVINEKHNQSSGEAQHLSRPRSHPDSSTLEMETKRADLSRLRSLQRPNSHPELIGSSRGNLTNDDFKNDKSDDGSKASNSGGSTCNAEATPRHSMSHRVGDSPRGSQSQNIEEQMILLRKSIRNRLDAVIPRVKEASSTFGNIDPYGDEFLVWAHSIASNGSRVEEQMSRKSRRLLKAAATLARCDGMSSRSAQKLVENGHEDKSFLKLKKCIVRFDREW
jgi:hypothetical protein